MTSAVCTEPARIMASATVRAYTKPLHTACTSKAGQPAMPSLCCTMVAVEGNTMSGVEVATMIRSTSCACLPAAASACRAAWAARSLLPTPGATKWRARMPVRSTIHSSEVSMPCAASSTAKSALLRRRGGRQLPVPVIRQKRLMRLALYSVGGISSGEVRYQLTQAPSAASAGSAAAGASSKAAACAMRWRTLSSRPC